MKSFATLVLVVLAVVGLTFSGCSKPAADSGAPAPSSDSAKPAEKAATPEAAPAATEATEVKPESAPAAASTEGMSAETPAAAPAPAAAAGAPITADSIVGTKWSASGMTFTFEKDGVLKVGAAGSELPGTWKIDGSSLTVGAMGQEFKAEIQGDKITYDGQPLERLP